MLDLYDELRAVVGAFEASGLPYAIVGGIAVSIYATPRATEDIDLLVDPARLDVYAEVLDPLGYQKLALPMRFAGDRIEIDRFTKLADNDHMVLDLVLAFDPSLADILARRIASSSGPDRLWLAPIDGLRALKRLRGSPQDLADLAALGNDKADE